MNRPIINLLFVILALGIVQMSFGQSDADWEIELRCLNETTSILPDGWSFSGTLILESRDKLHTYRQDWDTPHILLFTLGRNIPHSGQLSPDSKWFAIIKGNSERVQVVTLWTTDEIQVIDTLSKTQFTVDWNTGFTATHTLWGRFLEWLPDNKLLYSKTESDALDSEEWYVIDPFTSDVSKWESNINLYQDRLYFAPDGQKAVYDNYSGFFLHNGQKEIQLPIALASWNPDSTQFATFIFDENSRATEFVIYNTDGEVVTTVLNISSGKKLKLIKNSWSHDGRYIIFEADKIYIADTESEILIDPCIEARSMSVAWSQDNSQLAFIDEYDSKRRIQIIDFNLWERFVVGYHSGKVIGWRADDE